MVPLRLKRHEVARPKPRVCLEDGAMFAKFGDLNARLFRREFRGHANSTIQEGKMAESQQ